MNNNRLAIEILINQKNKNKNSGTLSRSCLGLNNFEALKLASQEIIC